MLPYAPWLTLAHTFWEVDKKWARLVDQDTKRSMYLLVRAALVVPHRHLHEQHEAEHDWNAAQSHEESRGELEVLGWEGGGWRGGRTVGSGVLVLI